MRWVLASSFCFTALLCSSANLSGQPANLCDIFRDLKSYNGRAVQIQAELFLDKDRTATAANCDESFVEESYVLSSALHLEPGPALSEGDRLELEHYRVEAIESRRSNKHVRVAALLEGSVETTDKYSPSSVSAEMTGDAYRGPGSFPARILLTRISQIHLEVLPDPEDLPVIDVCEVVSNLPKYNGKRIAIRGQIKGGYHGSAIYGPDCEQRFETDGYRWPTALYLGVPFDDSRFIKPLESDLKRSAITEARASELIRGRRNVRAIYTTVGIVHAREHYYVKCAADRLFGNGFGEMGFAPAEFFKETSLNPVVEPRLPSGDNKDEAPQCPSPKRLPSADCSALDIVAAAGNGCSDRVRRLAANRPVDVGNSALVSAAASGFVDIVQALIDAGVSPNVRWEDELPLCQAIENNRTQVVEALLAVGARLDNGAESQCSLLGAASHGDPKMVELLARNGANLEARNYFGRTPLMIAAELGKIANFHALLKAGADINAKDKDGGTALTHGSSSHSEIVLALLKDGAIPDAAGVDGITGLMYAAWESRDDIVRLLLDAGASVNLRDHQGDTALHKAVRSGYTDAIPVLLQFGANPGIRNNDGERPVDLAHGYVLEALRLKP
jgi:ankyrin repeat protein